MWRGCSIRRTRGRVVLGGVDMTGQGDRRRTEARRRIVGFVYQFHHLLPEFSAAGERDAAAAGRRGGCGGGAGAGGGACWTAVGLAARAGHRPAELSGGEQQRVAFCRAMANRPKLLLADEPTGNLDPATSERVFGVLTELVRETGLAALIATHNHELAGRLDRVVRLEGGRIVRAAPG